MDNQTELVAKMALDAWFTHVQRTETLFDSLSDEQLQQEVSPGRNRGIYLLGHLTAVHDRMMPLLGFGDPAYPELFPVFIQHPDKSTDILPTTADLRNYWKAVNENLAKNFRQLKPAEWLQKHTAVSEEDFQKEPHRNRLNVVINRTNHLSSHYGQLVFLK